MAKIKGEKFNGYQLRVKVKPINSNMRKAERLEVEIGVLLADGVKKNYKGVMELV